MPATTKVPLGAVTYVHKWYIDVNTGAYGAPTWTGIFGITDFKPAVDPTTKDDSDFDSVGWGSDVVSSRKWKNELKLVRKAQDAAPTAYDPGQEALRAASLLLGSGNRVDIRWYEMTGGGPKVEAYRGYASVTWTPEGGPVDEIEKVACTLNGSGAMTAITHPDGAQVAPVVTSITPNTGTTAGGVLVHIRGSHFMLAGVADVDAAADVMLAAHNFTSYTVADDSNIWGITPAETALPSAITVTNSIGASNTNVIYTSA